jgi:HK97 gp10 family phage protein
MPGTGVRVVQDTVTPRLANWTERMRREVEMELDVVGANMLDLSRSLVPVKTGFLRDSIAYDVRDLTIYFDAFAFYAPFVEFGTRFMAARPFIRPAVDAHRGAFEDAVMTGVRNAWNGF